jgi:hypothetical protein
LITLHALLPSIFFSGLCNSDEGVIDALACQAPRCLQQLSARALKHHACLAKAPQPPAAAAAQLLAALRAAAEALLVIGHHGDGKAQLRESECIPGGWDAWQLHHADDQQLWGTCVMGEMAADE